MSATERSKLLMELTRMKPDELRVLRDQATVLLVASPTKDDDRLQTVYDAAQLVLREFGFRRTIPWNQAQANKFFRTFSDGATIVADFIDENIHPKSRAERMGAAITLLRMIGHWRRSSLKHGKSVPVTFQTLSQSMKRVADISDRRFPGYRESGLLRVIIPGRRLLSA